MNDPIGIYKAYSNLNCVSSFPCDLLTNDNLENPMTQLQLLPLGIQKLGRSLLLLFLQLRDISGNGIQKSLLIFCLHLLTFDPCLQGFETDHWNGDELLWVWIVELSLTPESWIDSLGRVIQVVSQLKQ